MRNIQMFGNFLIGICHLFANLLKITNNQALINKRGLMVKYAQNIIDKF